MNCSSPGERGAGESPRRGIVVKVLITIIRGYQRGISPWFPPLCRFEPSCSQFGIEALRCHGVVRGMWLTAGRIMRCHPFSRGGYDPVPPGEESLGSR